MWTVLLLICLLSSYVFNVILVFELTDAYGAIIVTVVVIGSLMLAPWS